MSNVMCGVTDTSLDECPFAGWGVIESQCTHSRDIQLTCQGIFHWVIIIRHFFNFYFFTGLLESMLWLLHCKCDVLYCTPLQ